MVIAWRWLPEPEVMAEILKWRNGWVDENGRTRQISKEGAMELLDAAMRTKLLAEIEHLESAP